jgi:hypothetical protein
MEQPDLRACPRKSESPICAARLRALVALEEFGLNVPSPFDLADKRIPSRLVALNLQVDSLKFDGHNGYRVRGDVRE